MVLGDDFNPAFEAVPGLKQLLPTEMGGENKQSFEEICGNSIHVFLNTLQKFFCQNSIPLTLSFIW